MRKLAKLVLVALLLVLLASSVSAWGINPSRQRAEYTQDTQLLSITIENNQKVEGYFTVSFTDELKHYAKYIGPEVIYISEDESDYVVPFTLKLPDDLQGGTHKLGVRLQQVVGGSNTAMMGSLINLVGDVNVEVPYQDDAINAKLSIRNSKTDEPTPIEIQVVNRGKSSVSVWADITIKGPTNKEIANWKTDTNIIDVNGIRKLVSAWQGEKESGMYYAEINLHYNDKVMTLRDSFMVGGKEVVSESISSDRFQLGTIVPINIEVRNKFNEMINDVFAEVFVLEKDDGTILQTFKTPSVDIAGLGRETLLGYWDTAKLVVGEYNLNVLVNYEGGSTQKQYPVVVHADKLVVQNQLTGEVTGASSGKEKTDSIFIILLLVLIVTNGVIILYFTKMRKKKK